MLFIFRTLFPAEENGGPPPLGNERPKWAVFGKINQNMETVLFREKFVDWPDSSRLIQVKGQAGSSKESKAKVCLIYLQDSLPYLKTLCTNEKLQLA